MQQPAPNPGRDERRKPSRVTFYLQFAATTAGFMFSAYFVSTVLFDWGPHQDVPRWLAWSLGGFALAFTACIVLGLGYATSRGYRGWRLEGSNLILTKRQGGPVAVSIALAQITSVKAGLGDWDVIARAEGDDIEAVGLQETGGDLPGEKDTHHAEIEIVAQGRIFLVFTDSAELANNAQKDIEAAIRATGE